MRGISVNLTPSERFLSQHVSESTPRGVSPRLFNYLRLDNNRQYTKLRGFKAIFHILNKPGNIVGFDYTALKK
jgi:hypothetical protein